MSDRKNNNFALLHIIGALMVIWGHCYPLLQAEGVPVIAGEPLHTLGLKILFVVSGYLVAGSFLRGGKIGAYCRKRVLRIYPPFAVCILLTVLLLCPLSTVFAKKGFLRYVASSWRFIWGNLSFMIYFRLPGVFKHNPYGRAVNGSLWSLPIELALQLLLPLFLLPLRRVVKKRALAAGGMYLALAAAYYVMLRYDPGSRWIFWGSDWSHLIRLGVFFMGGVFFALLDIETLRTVCRMDAAIALLLLGVFFGKWCPQWLTGVLLPYVVITLAVKAPAWQASFWNRHDIAYGLYLWAFPVQQSLIDIFVVRRQVSLSVPMLFLMSTAVTALLAALQKRTVETWLSGLTLRRQKGDGGTSRKKSCFRYDV